MNPTTLITLTNADILAARIKPWLADDAGRYALVVSVAAATGPGAWCGVIERDGQPLLALAHTPPKPVLAIAPPGEPDPGAVEALADWFRQRPEAPRLNAPSDWVEAVAAKLPEPPIDRMQLQLQTLPEAPQLERQPPGDAREFLDDELPLLAAWLHGFAIETMPSETPPPPPTPAELLMDHDRRLAWVIDDIPVAMATCSRPVGNSMTINAVFTPPSQRNQGYAGAVVHALCQRLRGQGYARIVLYVDRANPASQRCYAKLGFVPACDITVATWPEPIRPDPREPSA